MIQNSTLFFFYNVNEDEDECELYNLNLLPAIYGGQYSDVYQYLDSLCEPAPDRIVENILERVKSGTI
jgi:hypothetical protein